MRKRAYGLIHQNSILLTIPVDQERTLFEDVIPGSGDLVGRYGPYFAASSWKAIRNGIEYREVWTFCEPGDEDKADRYLKRHLDAKEIDVFESWNFMRGKYRDVSGYPEEHRDKKIHFVYDAPWGDRAKIKELVSTGKDFGVYRDRIYYTTWSAKGFFIPLEGASPKRGDIGKPEVVKYQKLKTFIDPTQAPKAVDMTIRHMFGRSEYELPVGCFFPEEFLLDRHMRGEIEGLRDVDRRVIFKSKTDDKH